MHSREHTTLNVYALHQNMKHHGDICARVCKVVYVHAMKAYRVVEVQIHSLLTSALDWGDRSAISPILSYKKNRARFNKKCILVCM
jgi:hypothetical protein